MRYRALLTVAVMVAVVLQLPAGVVAKDFWFEYQKVLKTGRETELNLTYIGGDLEVTTTDQDQIVIEAVKRVNAVSIDEAELVADHIEIRVKQDKEKVTVSTNYLRMRNRGQSFWSKVLGIGGEDSYGQVDWKIQMPISSQISIINTSGQLKISNLMGDIEIRSSAADIELSAIEGSVSIDNAAGSAKGELLFGPVLVQQAQGTIDLQFVEGDIRIKSATADIKVRQDRGSLDLTTSSGNVDIQTNLDSSREFFVRTETGNISLSIPETSSGDLRIESQTGDISTDMPISIKSMSHKQVDGTFGYGGVKINLTSISGDVTVAQF